MHPHDSAAAMFAYHWVFVRIAERSMRQRHSARISEILAALAKRTFAPVPPKFRAAIENRNAQGWHHNAAWIGRESFVKLFPRKGKTANFMAPDKSPIGPVTTFVKTIGFREIASGAVSLAEVLARDTGDVALLHSLFTEIPRDFSFAGVPLIGADFPAHTMWFGVSEHAWLWDRPGEERAAACALPVRTLPELPLPSWSPLGDQVPPAISDGEFSVEGQRVALATYARASGMVVRTRRRGRIRADYLHGSIDGASGYTAIAPHADPSHRSSQHDLRHVLSALGDAGDMVPELLLLATELPVAAVAEEVHAFHAREQKPLQVFAASMADLRRRVRHFPWLRDEDGAGAPFFSTEDGDLGSLIRFACFLHTWRFLVPTATASVLRHSWESLRVPGSFDDLTGALERHSLLPRVFTAADFTLPQLVHFARGSPADLLVQEIEEWVIAHEQEIGPAWHAAVKRIAVTNGSMSRDLQVDPQPARSLIALRALMARDPDETTMEETALVMLLIDDVERALRMLDGLLASSPARAETVRERVLDIAAGHVARGDFERFVGISQWSEVHRSTNPRHFVTNAVSLAHDETLGELVVRHLVGQGLASHIVCDVDVGPPTVATVVARVVQRMSEENLSDPTALAGLQTLRDALARRE